MFDFLNTFIVCLLIFLASQYNYDIFSPIIIILYSIFFPGLSNLVFVVFFGIIIFFKFGELNSIWLFLLGLCVFVIIVASIIGKNKQPQEDSGGYEDLLKMLGNQ